MNEHFDDAVVGAGILGLAHAFQLGRRGRRVVVIERSARATGASIRNFGMIWPIGQPSGPQRELALRSRTIWLHCLAEAGIWHDRCGSLHLAYEDDEAQVLREFVDREHQAPSEFGAALELVDAAEVTRRVPMVRTDGLKCALASPSEICVDPREVIAGLPQWLEQSYGIRFVWQTTALGYERPNVQTTAGRFSADRLWVCAGDDLQTLYPESFAVLGLLRCKLQMMRTSPTERGVRIGPMLAAGLTLRHYRAFEGCPSLAALRARFAREIPEADTYGIHVMTSQNGRGEVILGDSHEYDDRISPFDRAEIESIILHYLATFLRLDALPAIAERWHGIYVKHPTEPWTITAPQPGVTAVTGLGGAGMTLSMGLAERVVADVLGGE
ncbi:MAG: TIGR03364 family FAD-dependent oxidoreductase [Isosphaeraceae bacterium]